MDHVAVGDAVLHYAGQTVLAVSTVTTAAVPSRRPDALPSEMWEQDGRLVRVDYRDAIRPVHRNELPPGWRTREPSDGPFKVDGEVKVGYLWPLSDTFLQDFQRQFGDRFPVENHPLAPDAFVPAEARESAGDLLRRLIGVPLRTVAGATNTVLGVRGDSAIVATGRSPKGQPVPVRDVQRALDLLVEAGSITIHPEDVGYRSAFIGAALSTLPGARISGDSPPELRLVGNFSSGVDAATEATRSLGDFTFQGDLSVPVLGVARGEQGKLRQRLFGSATSANCAVCGERFPVRFLWAAHIKKRSVCSDDERRDLGNIGMPACVFGCDALYESGYVGVDESGHVRVSYADEPAVAERLAGLEGRGCLAFSAKSSAYFAWHRTNVWRGLP
ncbi:hypothetical protein AB6N24_08715 [Cellulomonas sp. 179-A 4D5 NHS]|uniref:hypothetical protein n=1 Tax=Cellulomonas sp. 179-A 4D5 NHS TaxID=3142378 RepID=UPI0039A31335